MAKKNPIIYKNIVGALIRAAGGFKEMRRLLKKSGRFFITSEEKNEKALRQSVLLIDGSFLLPNNFALIIKGVEKKFKNAKLTILTFKDKKEFIRDNFPDAEVVVPEGNIRVKRYQLAIQLLAILRRDFNFVVLSSLDISVLSPVLFFARCPVLLHNRWLQWYRIRLRTLSDVLRRRRSADTNRRRKNNSLVDVLKSIGRLFFILTSVEDKDIVSRILIVDNGYTEIGHVLTAVRRAEEVFINPEISVITFAKRKHYFIDTFPQVHLAIIEDGDRGDRFIRRIFQLRKNKISRVILTALDIIPVLASFLIIRKPVLLYNRWNQWWVLRFRDIPGYVKKVLCLLIMIPVSVYLLIRSAFILLNTSLRLGSRLKEVIKQKR